MAASQTLSASDAQLSTLVAKHGTRKFWAGVKAVGLEADDLDKTSHKNRVVVHSMVPEASSTRIKDHRSKIWDDLRQDRIRALEATLESLNDEDVRHFENCGVGVNPVRASDLPPVEQLSGMEVFAEMQEANERKVKAEQAKKARALGVDFLLEKKKRDEADAKVAAFEKRIEEYQKAQADEWKARKTASEKKSEKRTADAARAAQARAEWEDQCEEDLWARMDAARKRRADRYSPVSLAAKLEANKKKREIAFHLASEQEAQLMAKLNDKQEANDRRLQEHHEAKVERLIQVREAQQARFQNRQVVIHAKTTEWVENKLDEHRKYNENYKQTRQRNQDNLKEKSKSTGDLRKKAHEKVRANNERLANGRDDFHDHLREKHHFADMRREELETMKFKNENDVFTFREMKHNTFGELQQRRRAEIKKRTDAHLQSLVFDLAERGAKQQAQEESKVNLWKCRQQIAKEGLTFQDRAYEGFLKIQSEPDEAKVIATMNAMGFDMPKLPEEDEEGGEEGGSGTQKAF